MLCNIIQKNPAGEIVKTWNTLKEIAEYYQVSPGAINLAIRRGKRSCGYFWSEDSVKDFEEEDWKKHPSVNVLVSSLGRLKNPISGRIIKSHKNSNGYFKAVVFGRCYTTHRLVAQSFIACSLNSRRIRVNHKNLIKSDNRVLNLEWCTASENTQK